MKPTVRHATIALLFSLISTGAYSQSIGRCDGFGKWKPSVQGGDGTAGTDRSDGNDGLDGAPGGKTIVITLSDQSSFNAEFAGGQGGNGGLDKNRVI